MKILVTLFTLVGFANFATSADFSYEGVAYVPSHSHQATDASPANVRHFDAIDTVKADRVVVYSASWCGPCQRLKPILATLKREGYRVEQFDIDKHADKLKYDHKLVPSIYFLRGDTIVKKETGCRSKEHILKTLTIKPSQGTSISIKQRTHTDSEPSVYRY